ncbi:hypothetical protein [Halovenus sp. HT40]|uniref:hypothetical protein n=1 Tax=Halovenus sp. HT40 TaxID=3126691 RepID=UPI00300EBF5D
MAVQDLNYEIPTWAAALITVFVLFSFAYGVLIQGSFLAPIVLWLWLGGIALSLFVVYLLYRFVIAVEKIADKM